MKLLGVDFGGTRIGLATVDTVLGLPTPKGVVRASGTLATDAAEIKAVADREGAQEVILGVPLDAEGETQMSKVCRMLGERIAELGLRVTLVDEALTSAAAEGVMREAGLTGAEIRKRVDSEAACRILERYLEGHGEEA